MEDEEFLNLLELVDQFNQMLKNGNIHYFDIDQFEAISDYYYDLGKLNKALKAVELAAAQHPYHSNFYFRKVQYLTASNQVKEADIEIKKLEKSSGNSFDLHMARAGLQSKLGHHQKAIRHYKQALQNAEYPEDVWGLLALEYQLLGEYEKALKYLRLTLEENSQDEIGIYNIALCFDMLEQNEEGIKFFDRFINQNPYSEVAWYHLGILHAKQKEFDAATKALDYAILIDEYFSAAYFEKARIQEKVFKYKEAIETYKATFETDGHTGYSYYKIGLCYLKMHNHKKAISYFTKAIHEDDDLDEAFFELALLKDEDREWSEAIYFMEKALDLDPENIDYMSIGADIYKRAGRLDEAEVLYEAIIELGITEPGIFIDYAELLFDMCEFDNGMEILYQGVQQNPKSAEAHYRLAGYLYTLQESDEADIYFRKAINLNSDRRLNFFELFPKLKNHPSIQSIIEEKRLNQ